MREFLKSYKDIILTFILALVVTLIDKSVTMNNSVFEVIKNFLPYAVVIIFASTNKLNIYKKFILFFKKKNSIGIKHTMIIKDVDLDIRSYNKLVNEYLKYFNDYSDKKILTNNTGEYLCKSIIRIGYISSEIIYNCESGELIIITKNNARFGFIYELIKNIDKGLKDSVAKCASGYNGSSAQLEIEFISNGNITNPLVNRLFEGIDLKSVNINYVGRNNSNIRFENKSINFFNNDSEKLIKDVKNELMLW